MTKTKTKLPRSQGNVAKHLPLASNGHANPHRADVSPDIEPKPHRFDLVIGKYRENEDFAEVWDTIEAARITLPF